MLVIIPAYNEEDRIAAVITACKHAGYDVLVVDDGSDDNTAAHASAAGARVVSHLINRGAGAATQTGFEIAKVLGATTVVTMDADGQHDTGDMQSLLDQIVSGTTDVVIGSRFRKTAGEVPFLRGVFNGIANVVTYLLTGIWTTDSQSGMKGFGPKALEKIRIHTDGFEFCTEIFQEMNYHGLRFAEVPITVRYTSDSMKKGQNFSTGLTTIVKLLLRSLMR